ncbi:zinc ribbon domain-containing protein [Butyrivibrio sp. AD3002]|uniref:zinc ribbon domain-containing protein n=1 Tax=Butyrivibrio sp. AD3002 TaxID=1280670 RepID=UPI0003B57C93|nr:zinc ribbon domain-containing protein [Butyrivibrio sp. AD3002]
MYCTNCGKDIPDNSVFCPCCGEKILKIDADSIEKTPQEVNTAPITPTNIQNSDGAKGSIKKKIIIIGAITALAILIGFIGFIIWNKDNPIILGEHNIVDNIDTLNFPQSIPDDISILDLGKEDFGNYYLIDTFYLSQLTNCRNGYTSMCVKDPAVFYTVFTCVKDETPEKALHSLKNNEHVLLKVQYIGMDVYNIISPSEKHIYHLFRAVESYGVLREEDLVYIEKEATGMDPIDVVKNSTFFNSSTSIIEFADMIFSNYEWSISDDENLPDKYYVSLKGHISEDKDDVQIDFYCNTEESDYRITINKLTYLDSNKSTSNIYSIKDFFTIHDYQ